MKKTKTIAELLSSCNTKTPVEDTVVKRWDDIVDCLATRCSFAKIAQALRLEGEFVGNKDNTGFTQAVKRVAARKGVELHEVRNGDWSGPRPHPERAAVRGLPKSEIVRDDIPFEALSPQTDIVNDVSINAAASHGEPSTPPASPTFGDTRHQSDF